MSLRSATGSLRELARRESNSTEIALFWNQTTGELTVCVGNDERGTYFELNPLPEQALDCFYHPYSYAAVAGVPDLDALVAQ
jgi:hypothetical protein